MSLFSMFNRTPDADPGPSADELELERIREKAALGAIQNLEVGPAFSITDTPAEEYAVEEIDVTELPSADLEAYLAFDAAHKVFTEAAEQKADGPLIPDHIRI